MSKRKNRNKAPNLPEETLRRARQEAGLEEAPPDDADADMIDDTVDAAEPPAREQVAPPVAVPAPSRRRARSADSAASTTSRRPRRRVKDKDFEEMTAAEVAHLLENPTRIVTEDELRAQYAYVIRDLRSMAILAAILFVGMIVVASILV